MAIVLFDNHKQAERAYQAARQEYEETKRASPLGRTPNGESANYKSYRDEWRAEQDLEAQREMARTSWWMMAYSLVGIILLAATFWETARAAQGAADAASASKDTVKAMTASERAVLHIIVHSQTIQHLVGVIYANPSYYEGDFRQISVDFQFKNYGRTPAFIRQITAELRHLSHVPEEIRYLPTGIYLPMEHALVADKSTDLIPCTCPTPIDVKGATSIKNGDSAVYFYGHVLYDDIFGERHEHRFFWRYDGRMELFAPYHYKDFNQNT